MHSKTDREKKGTHILIAKTNSAFCPFSFMSRYFRTRAHANQKEPLFATEDGRPMTNAYERYLCPQAQAIIDAQKAMCN